MRAIRLHGRRRSWLATTLYPYIMPETQSHIPLPVEKNNYKRPPSPGRLPPGRRRAARARAGAFFFDSFLISFYQALLSRWHRGCHCESLAVREC